MEALSKRIDKPVELHASIRECTDRKTILYCRVISEGAVTAEGEVIAIRVPETELIDHAEIRIGKQPEFQSVRLDDLPTRVRGIDTDREHLGVQVGKIGDA